MKLAIPAAALIATVAASSLERRDTAHYYNSTCTSSDTKAKIVNRCSYPVHVWSIDKQLGCPEDAGLVLNQGEFYHEKLRNGTDGGISIKLSKYETCGGNDLTQLEYKLNYETGYEGDYLDISFVDCTSGDCQGWHDGFYFKAGDQQGVQTSAVDNEHCPIFSVGNAVEAAKVAYVNWDDRQTKWCPNEASMELYLCGSEEPSEGGYTPAPSSSEEAAPSSTPEEVPSTTEKPAYTPPAYTPEANVAAAAITSAPAAQPPKVVKTEVVYETVYVKRDAHAHAHAHGRRHQQFHA